MAKALEKELKEEKAVPKISVIIPVYKAEAYLAECIDSVLVQSFSDFELILVDDGSPDRCADICREYLRKDSRIRFLQQENGGQASARNHAMTIAKGQWIAFVDSDDVIHPQYLQILYDAAMAWDVPISMCRYVEAQTMPEGFPEPCRPEFEVLSMKEDPLTDLYDREEYPGWVACTKLVRRDVVEGYPFTEGRVFEDNEAVCRWICSAGALASTEQALYYYRTNGDSTTKSKFSLKKLDYLWALESITGFYGNIGYRNMQRRFADRYADAAAESCYGVRCELDRPDLAKEIYAKTRRWFRQHKLTMTQAQFEKLLDAAHPEWMRYYWPLAGIRRRVRKLMGRGEQG